MCVSKFAVTCSGFWEVYSTVREFVHNVLRRELSREPAVVYFTGHSMGGALACIASADVALNTLPRVNAFLKHKRNTPYVQQHTSVFI